MAVDIDEEDLKDYLRLSSDLVRNNTEIVKQSDELP